MIIDSVTDKKGLDIDSLTFPEQAKRERLKFDPEVDLTAVELNRAVGHLSELRSRLHSRPELIGEWAKFARPLVFLFPEEKDRLGIDEEMRVRVFARMGEFRLRGESPDGRTFLGLAANAKILYPSEVNELELGEDVFRFILGAWENFNDQLDSEDLLNTVILFPNRRDELLRLDQGIPDSLISNISFDRRHNIWLSVASEASDLKLLWPERLPELSPADWVILRREFGEEKRLPVMDIVLFYFALDLLVLAADEARIGEEGLVINLRKPGDPEMREKVPDMPVKRIF